jgi:hypothetical protein
MRVVHSVYTKAVLFYGYKEQEYIKSSSSTIAKIRPKHRGEAKWIYSY